MPSRSLLPALLALSVLASLTHSARIPATNHPTNSNKAFSTPPPLSLDHNSLISTSTASRSSPPIPRVSPTAPKSTITSTLRTPSAQQLANDLFHERLREVSDDPAPAASRPAGAGHDVDVVEDGPLPVHVTPQAQAAQDAENKAAAQQAAEEAETPVPPAALDARPKSPFEGSPGAYPTWELRKSAPDVSKSTAGQAKETTQVTQEDRLLHEITVAAGDDESGVREEADEEVSAPGAPLPPQPQASVVLARKPVQRQLAPAASVMVARRHALVKAGRDELAGVFGRALPKTGATPVLWVAPFLQPGVQGGEAVLAVKSLLPYYSEFPLIVRDADPRPSTHTLKSETRGLLRLLNASASWESLDNSIVVCDSEPDNWQPYNGTVKGLTACPTVDPVLRSREARFVIGRTMCDTDGLPHAWKSKMADVQKYFDEFWVPSTFNLNTFRAAGVPAKKLHVMPLATDCDLYNPDVVPANASKLVFPEDRDKFRFLSVFPWSSRKGWDVLLRAFAAEFRAKDNATLYVLTHGYNATVEPFDRLWDKFILEEQKRQRLAGATLTPHAEFPTVRFFNGHIPQSELLLLYRSVQAYVLPSRGEARGRTLTESMCMRLPVISTDWGATTDFLTETNGFPLNVDGVEPVAGEPGTKRARPSPDHLRKLMRQVFSDLPAARARAKHAREDVVGERCVRCVAQQMLDRLRESVRQTGGSEEVGESSEQSEASASDDKDKKTKKTKKKKKKSGTTPATRLARQVQNLKAEPHREPVHIKDFAKHVVRSVSHFVHDLRNRAGSITGTGGGTDVTDAGVASRLVRQVLEMPKASDASGSGSGPDFSSTSSDES